MINLHIAGQRRKDRRIGEKGLRRRDRAATVHRPRICGFARRRGLALDDRGGKRRPIRGLADGEQQPRGDLDGLWAKQEQQQQQQ